MTTAVAAPAMTDTKANGHKGGANMQAIPKPAIELAAGNGKILDAHGETLPPATKTLMGRFDAKASEKVELSRGTVWLIATVLVLLGVAFSYGSSVLTWTREDQTTRERTIQTSKDVEEMRQDMRELKQTVETFKADLQAQAIKDAENKGKTQGFQLGVAEAQTPIQRQKK